MMEATFVLFVPRARLTGLRAFFGAQPADDLRWREKKGRAGSEFYVSGPVRRARESHERAATWLMRSNAQV